MDNPAPQQPLSIISEYLSRKKFLQDRDSETTPATIRNNYLRGCLSFLLLIVQYFFRIFILIVVTDF